MRTDVDLRLGRGLVPQAARPGARAPAGVGSRQWSEQQAQIEAGRLREVAQEFESLLLEQLFKDMRASIPKSGLLGKDSSMDTFQEMLDGEFSRALAHRGGIGLADFMVAHMQPGESARLDGLNPSSLGEKGRSLSHPGPRGLDRKTGAPTAEWLEAQRQRLLP